MAKRLKNPMTATQFAAFMRATEFCPASRRWAKGKTPIQAWRQCRRPGWMTFAAYQLAKRAGDSEAARKFLCYPVEWDPAVINKPLADDVRAKFPLSDILRLIDRCKTSL